MSAYRGGAVVVTGVALAASVKAPCAVGGRRVLPAAAATLRPRRPWLAAARRPLRTRAPRRLAAGRRRRTVWRRWGVAGRRAAEGCGRRLAGRVCPHGGRDGGRRGLWPRRERGLVTGRGGAIPSRGHAHRRHGHRPIPAQPLRGSTRRRHARRGSEGRRRQSHHSGRGSGGDGRPAGREGRVGCRGLRPWGRARRRWGVKPGGDVRPPLPSLPRPPRPPGRPPKRPP